MRITGVIGGKALGLALAAAASLIELGPIAALLYSNASLLAILTAGLAYQAGNALPRSHLPAQGLWLAAIATAGVLTAILAQPARPEWYAAIVAISWSLQGIRRQLSESLPSTVPATAHKRAARVVGFVLATVLPLTVALIFLSLIALLPLAVHRREAGHPGAVPPAPRQVDLLEAVMVVHQTHYFSYCYALPVLFNNSALGGTSAVGIWFAAGWISYLAAESIWRRFNPTYTFIVGHIVLGCLLLIMTLSSDSPSAIVLLWILSGLGGGTVYCISLLHQAARLPTQRLEVAEDVGHLSGVLIAISTVTCFSWTANMLPAVGAVWAVLAAGCMIISALRNNPSVASITSSLKGNSHADQ